MKKLITLLFAAAFVTAASAQSGGYRNDSRSYNNNSYSSQYQHDNQYNRNSQWNDRRGPGSYERRRRLAERQRYERMMRSRARYHDRRYYPSYGYSNRPTFQLSIGIGGRR